MRHDGNTATGRGPGEPIEIEVTDDATEFEIPLTREQLLAQLR